MKTCHILTENPEESLGGTPTVVRNIKNKNSKVIYGRGFGPIKSVLYPLVIPLIVRKKYDLVNIHDMQGYGYALLPKLFRKKIVYTAHGLWINYFNALPPADIFHKIKASVAKKIQGFIARRADITVAVSNKVKKDLIEYYGIGPKKIRVIHNGVDTKAFYPIKGRNKATAIWVGNNPVLKGLKTAIDYAKKNKMKLLIVGVKGGNTENLEYIEKLNPNRLLSLYNKASTLLFFSKAEGHPLVPLEAMACGLNIIASKESNIEIIPQQKDGTYKISGKLARKIALKHDWSGVRKKYNAVYEELLI